MALYVCRCGAKFDVPFRECQPIPGVGREFFSTCPECGSLEFEESWHCRGCSKAVQYSDLIAGEYCKDCVQEAMNDPALVREYLMNDDVRANFAEFLTEINWKPGEGDVGE